MREKKVTHKMFDLVKYLLSLDTADTDPLSVAKKSWEAGWRKGIVRLQKRDSQGRFSK
jgi:hypothetical protein